MKQTSWTCAALFGALFFAACGGPEPHTDTGHDAHEIEHEDIHHDDHDSEADHDHAEGHSGGQAHVHGLADLTITPSGEALILTLDAPAANFGLSESLDTLPKGFSVAEESFSLIGGKCTLAASHPVLTRHGDHASILVEQTYTCRDLGSVKSVRAGLFAAYPGFEHIDAIYLDDAHQHAEELTPSSPSLTLP